MTISKRDTKALQIAGSAVALFLLFQFGVFPIWDTWQEEQANLPLRESTFVKYRNAVATTGRRGADAAVLETRLREAEAGLLTGNTTAIASAELQEWVKQLASEQSIEIRSSEFLPVKPRGDGYWEVPLRLQFQCRLDALVNFWKALGGGSKSLVVSRWNLQSFGSKDKLINVSITVAGILRSQESEVGSQESRKSE